MQSALLSNSIYQHSGETEKDNCIAQQASVNEDQEQRRRQLDSQGETIKMVVAKEVASMVDQYGGDIHLKHVTMEAAKEPLLQQATHAASNVLHNAIATGLSIFHTATDTVSSVTGKVTSITKEAASTASHIGHDAVGYVSSATKSAGNFVTHAAQEAVHQATDLAGKVVDTTTHAAEAVTHKAFELADNIGNFTTLVGVLAEEETERARRLVSGDEALAAANAFRVSELIRDLGIAFYKQETPNLNYCTKILEEAERRWRLNANHGMMAERNAHSVGKLVNKNMQSFMPRYQWVRQHIASIEEKERNRRLNDYNETYAILNALNISALLSDLDIAFYRQTGTFSRSHGGYATTLLEEIERRNRIREDKLHHAEDSAHLLMDVVANNMEKFNFSTRYASKFANDFAALVGSATSKAASSFSALTQELAKNTAERVRAAASDISHFANEMYIIALEERERASRLSDPDEVYAIQNAWAQSQLIRNLSALYRPGASAARYPIGLIEEQERRWRIDSLSSSVSSKVASMVSANISQFTQASMRAGAAELAHEAVLRSHPTPTHFSHARLNPNAPVFVPHQQQQQLPTKAEPALVQQPLRAAGAQH